MKKSLIVAGLSGAMALAGLATAPVSQADTTSSQFTGTVSEIVDTAADTGIPRRWMRHVGNPAPEGYSHGYQWGAPAITTPAGTVTFEGTLDVVDAVNGDFGLIGLLDTATLEADERGLNEGAYIYVTMKNADSLILGLSDGRAAGGEYVQTFHTIDLTSTDRVFDVTFTIDPMADPATCASNAADAPTAEGCLTLQVDDRPAMSDSYGSITNDGANGGIEFAEGGTAGWDGLASATAATGFDYDFTVTPTIDLDLDNDGIDDTPAPTSKDECKKNGWKSLNNPTFRNQGDCVSFVATGGKNGPKG